MVFSSLTFLLLFFPIVLFFYFLVDGLRWKNGVLLIFSLLFYAWGEPVWVLAMIGSTLINYVCALIISQSRCRGVRKIALTIGVVASVAMLFYFKYAAFLFNSFSGIFGAGVTLPVLELPIGISFYTFQILTYTVDVYRGKAPCMRSFPRLMLYISCFPQLIAGPIVQYADVCEALSDRKSTSDGFIIGMRRFSVGLAKKVLIANVCALALKQMPIGGESSLSFVGAWYAAILYSLQIYFDFAGYSDMAIGMGHVFGFKYKENFNYP
ncbi:MAG: MBOAT family protein, partial [Oscillospiraceae bacterium]|nr:MBOAT family protein [Oscillospiraceae bacterium]